MNKNKEKNLNTGRKNKNIKQIVKREKKKRER